MESQVIKKPPKECKSCRSQEMLKNVPSTLDIVAVHTDENERIKFRGDLFTLFIYLRLIAVQPSSEHHKLKTWSSVTSTEYCHWCWNWGKVYWIFCSCDTKDKYFDPESQGYVGIHKLCGDCLSNEDVPPWSPHGVERAKYWVDRLFASTISLPDLALDKIASYLVCDMKP